MRCFPSSTFRSGLPASTPVDSVLPSMKARVIDSIEALDALRAGWERLEIQSSFLMQHFIWAQAAAASLTREGELHIVVIEEGGEVKAIAPLVHRKGSSCLEILGVSELYEPTDMIWADPAALDSLTTALVDLGVPLYLTRIPAHSPLTHALKKAYRSRGVLISRADGPWPEISLDAGWAEPENKFNSKRRAYLRRARRIADELGTVSTEVLSP